MKTIGNVTRIVWRFYVAGPKWARKWFQVHYVPDQIDGVMYAGVTVFGVSLLYSTEWW